MNKYHITYFYLATGMEGIPDISDYGIVEANSEEEAKEIITKRQHHKSETGWAVEELDNWFKSCLTAKLIK